MPQIPEPLLSIELLFLVGTAVITIIPSFSSPPSLTLHLFDKTFHMKNHIAAQQALLPFQLNTSNTLAKTSFSPC